MKLLFNIQRIKELDELPTLIISSTEINSNFLPKGPTKYYQYITNDGIKSNELLQKIKLLVSEEDIEPKPAKTDEIKPAATVDYVQPTPEPSIEQEEVDVKRPSSARKKVLIIEDNDDSRIAVNALLKDSYDIINSSDGIDGLNKAKFSKPDIILLDISLPLMDGLEVVRILKSNDDTKTYPSDCSHSQCHDK